MRAVSRRPRRLTTARKATHSTPIQTRSGYSDGKADVMAATPAATLTATVTTYPTKREAPAVRPGSVPRFSRATVYAPPPPGYACMVCQYEVETTPIRKVMAIAIGTDSDRAAVPA